MNKLSDSHMISLSGSIINPTGTTTYLMGNASAPLSKTPPAASNQALRMRSSSANDTSAGSGATEWTVIGVDANFDKVTQTVATNGTNNVNLTTDIMMWNEINTTGTGGGASYGSDGLYTLETQAGAEQGRGTNSNESCRYICPNGYKAFIMDIAAGAGSDAATEDAEGTVFSVRLLDYNNNIDTVYWQVSTKSHMSVAYDGPPLVLSPGQMVYMTYQNFTAQSNRVNGSMRIIEIAESEL